jgi:hypothetical protein
LILRVVRFSGLGNERLSKNPSPEELLVRGNRGERGIGRRRLHRGNGLVDHDRLLRSGLRSFDPEGREGAFAALLFGYHGNQDRRLGFRREKQ